jgi:hypothetical protein
MFLLKPDDIESNFEIRAYFEGCDLYESLSYECNEMPRAGVLASLPDRTSY